MVMCAAFDLHLQQLDVNPALFMENLKKKCICSNHKDLKNKKTWFAG